MSVNLNIEAAGHTVRSVLHELNDKVKMVVASKQAAPARQGAFATESYVEKAQDTLAQAERATAEHVMGGAMPRIETKESNAPQEKTTQQQFQGLFKAGGRATDGAEQESGPENAIMPGQKVEKIKEAGNALRAFISNDVKPAAAPATTSAPTATPPAA